MADKRTYAEMVQGTSGTSSGLKYMRNMTYAEIVQTMSDGRRGRVEYPVSNAMSALDPCFVDYDRNLIGIRGDGNCMFRAIAFAVGEPGLDHKKLRHEACNKLGDNIELRTGLGFGFDDYQSGMRQDGKWGGEPELIASAQVVQRHICVWVNGGLFVARGDPDHPVIHLSYENGSHYNVLIVDPSSLRGDPPPMQPPNDSEIGKDIENGWTVVKRGRGRPKKNFKTTPFVGQSKCGVKIPNAGNSSDVANAALVQTKPRCGRPPKRKGLPPSRGIVHAGSEREKMDVERETTGGPSKQVLEPIGQVTVVSQIIADCVTEKNLISDTPAASEPAEVPVRSRRGRPKKLTRVGRAPKNLTGVAVRNPNLTDSAHANVDESNANHMFISKNANTSRGLVSSHLDGPEWTAANEKCAELVDHFTESNSAVGAGVALLTRVMLDKYSAEAGHAIVIQCIDTDLCSGSSASLNGPWPYRNKNNVFITYLAGDSGEPRQIRLTNLMLRGFCGPSRNEQPRYKFYSWLRFKDIVKRYGYTVSAVVSDEQLFHEVLREIDGYYCRHLKRVEEEGLLPHKGPQVLEDRHNVLQLHYYGKGLHKFFRLITFKELFISRYDEKCWVEFLADPWMETVTEEHFEQLLSDVHVKVRRNQSRYTHLFEPYAGPQCHEDRGCAARLQYNVLFVTQRTTSSGRGGRRNSRPVAQAPPQRITAPAANSSSELSPFFLRACVDCGSLRVLDERAAAKYPLGQYTYAGTERRVRFTCDRLVGISCDTPPDFVACTVQDKPSTWVAMGAQSAGDVLPPPAILMRSLRALDADDHTEEVEIVASYHYRQDSHAVGWAGRHSILTRTSNSGLVTLGTLAKRRRFQEVTKCRFTAGRFTVDSPREAKCCQPWHDPLGTDPEDPSADLRVINLQTLRDIHALYDSLRRVRCIKCNQQTPGLPYPDYQIRVPECGRMTDLSQDSIVSAAVAQSALLKAGSQCSITLDPKFRGANGTVLTDRDASGVCTVCASAYDLDADNNIIPRPLASDIDGLRPDPRDVDDFVGAEMPDGAEPSVSDAAADSSPVDGDGNDDEPEPTHISLFSIENLVSIDVYSDEAYQLFLKTLTPAEIMVLRPVHLVVSVLRLRSNQVPFSKYGTISFPLKDARQAHNLPWFDFRTLPFIVLVQNRRDGTSGQAMVNMENILRAKEFMERRVPCKYSPRQTRPYYRFVAEQWTPFSNDNLAKLQDQLTASNQRCTPTGLRVLVASDIHARADKVLRFNEFCNWLESGFAMADELWKSFQLSRSGEGSDTTEARQDDLWRAIEEHVVGLAVDAAAKRHEEQAARPSDADGDESDADEIDITMRHVLDCAVAKGWLLSAAVDGADAGSTGEPSSVLLRCCEELEMLGREFGNDEGNRAGGISAGAISGPQTERPDDIRQQGISRSALLHVPMPGVDRENPLPESAPGYMQMAFPEVFRSGDADPYQDRRVSIQQPITSWRANWLHWMARQPEAEGNVEFQFVVGSQLSRDRTGQEAKVAIRMADFPDGLPTKEELMNDLALRKKVGQALLCLSSKLEDSDAYWRVKKHEASGIIRYLENPPPWRPDAIPQEVYLWQTRAVPYNHHPAIHRLCDEASCSEALADERYLSARLANTMRHPGIVAWMSALIGEIDTLALAMERFGTTYYLVRSEWGANANPHVHRHLISESFSRFLHELQNSLKRRVADLERDLRAEDPTLERDVSRSVLETGVDAAWRDCQQQYITRVGGCYTNWNAGLTKDGERTFDFAYDRKTTVCRARMAATLDDALSTGSFAVIDDLYVRVINGTLRHTGHSGRGDAPSAKDGCAVRRLVVDKAATKEARSAGCIKTVKKEMIVCKRRMPRRLRSEPAVVKDAHDPRFYQFETASNDKWMGGHDPFTVLHILNNIDDKAVVPAWLTRTPRVEWKNSPAEHGGYTFDVQLSKARGDGSVEYALKYGFKPVAPIRTPGDVLLTALERREADDNVDLGVIKRMYNQVAASSCQSIFQVVHKNWQLPLLQKNVDARSFNLSGCRMVKPATAAADPVYVYAGPVERFNARVGDNIRHGNIPRAEIQRVMSVFEFHDKFTSVEKTEAGEKVFHIGRRCSVWKGARKLVMLAPHHGKMNANPTRAQFWKYARDIVLWCEPCWVSQDLMPPPDFVTDDAIAAHWRAKYDQLMASDVYKPLWVTRYHDEHSNRATEVSDDESEESDGGDESDGVADADAEVDEHEPNAERVRDRFYQTALDCMVACPPENIDDAERLADRAAASVANPAGYDFQAQWLGDRVVNPDHVRRNYARLATLGAGDAAHAAPITPSGRQLVLPCIVKSYVVKQREWARSRREWDAYDQAMLKWRRSRSSRVTEPVPPSVADIRDRPPKALRAFLLGDPGAGKSTTLRTTVHELTEMLVDDHADWTDVVKLSAPTGCASFHMAHGATTIHRLYAIRVGQVNDDPLPQDSRRLVALCERLGPELGLLIFDEFSMIQRKMLRWVMKRLGEAGINLDHIGVLFVGDPAQILPIGDSPVWSIRQRTDDGKECSEASLLGMAAFRELFRMPPLDTVDGHDAWRRAADRTLHELNDNERREVARFHAGALVGDYETVYLNEVRRTVENDHIAGHLTKVIIPSFRYGKATRENLEWLRENTATAEHMAADPLWSGAVTLHGNHWFSELAENRATVESDNARALVRFANERDTPVMAVNAQHLPARKALRLQKLSAKEFRSVPAVFFACSGLPLMLLENVAPSVGLFNGARVEFVGPLYLDDDWQVTLTRQEYKDKVVTNGVTLTAPIDTPASDRERMYQIPVGSVIIKVNGHTVDGDERRLAELVAESATVRLVFHTPNRPPQLPDFMVVRVPSYTDNGGPNVLGIEDADDLVPIRMVKRGRDKGKKGGAADDDKQTEFRIGPPLEGGSAFTGFKGQGATLERVVAKVKAWVETPGFWTVVVSRVRHPHHLHIPADQWPTVEELRVQRLNQDVLEAEIFERQMKINAAKTWRHFVASEGDGDWSHADNVIGDAVHTAWRQRHECSVSAVVCHGLRAKDIDVSQSDVEQIIERMAVTDESLILSEPVYNSRLQRGRLLQSKVQRGRRRFTGTTGSKRTASTSASRGRRTKSRRLT